MNRVGELLDAECAASFERCFDGAIPAVLATAGPDGIPNVTYISKAHRVDAERIALSNQFMSKTARNLAANPRANLLLIDPVTHDEFRLAIVYERTERRGHVFERLRADVDAIAAMEGMQDVFRLRAADIFRVVDVVQIPPNPSGTRPADHPERSGGPDLGALAELSARIGRCADLDTLVDVALDGIVQLLGYPHVHLLLLDEEGRHLYTIGSRGFDDDSVGAEVAVGDGMIGVAAQRCEPMRVGNLQQMLKYSRSMRAQYEEAGGVRTGREVPMPGLPGTESRLVVPMKALGELIGVLTVDSTEYVAFGERDEQALGVVATLLANAIEHLRSLEREPESEAPAAVTAPSDVASPVAAAVPVAPALTVRWYDVDGSVFLGDEYLIKGVAGRILRSLLDQHLASGRVDFSNKELRLDPSLELPGFKDNLESRLLLLKRRLDERGAPIRIEKTGRGRFRLELDVPVRVQRGDA